MNYSSYWLALWIADIGGNCVIVLGITGDVGMRCGNGCHSGPPEGSHRIDHSGAMGKHRHGYLLQTVWVGTDHPYALSPGSAGAQYSSRSPSVFHRAFGFGN